MSVVKRGAYGYGQSKPVMKMNYHTQNPDSVTTVVTEISRMTVNEKPPVTGAVQKHATLEEVCEEKAGAYSAPHGGALQKHTYSEQKASYQHGSGVGGYVDALHHDGTGAAQNHGYGEQKAYQHGVDAGGYGSAVQKQHGYGEHQAYQHGGDLKGYTALHHESTVQKHGYGDGAQKAYQHGSDVVGGYGHDVSAVQKHGYGGQKAYQHGADAGGYGAVHHGSAVQKHGYAGEHQAYQHGGVAGGYGAIQHDGAYGGHKEYPNAGDGYGVYQQGCVDDVGGYDAIVQKGALQKQYGYGGGYKTSTYDGVGGFDALVQKNAMQKQKLGYGAGHKAYQPGCDGVAGYDALVQNKAMQKHAYGAGGYALGHGPVTGAVHRNQGPAAYGKTYKQQIAGAGGHQVGALPYPESDCSSEESDCDEELAYGGNRPGTTHQYSTYEHRQQHGGGSLYESYQSTTTQGYSGGGYGW